jgi:hypothetical protein
MRLTLFLFDIAVGATRTEGCWLIAYILTPSTVLYSGRL